MLTRLVSLRVYHSPFRHLSPQSCRPIQFNPVVDQTYLSGCEFLSSIQWTIVSIEMEVAFVREPLINETGTESTKIRSILNVRSKVEGELGLARLASAEC